MDRFVTNELKPFSNGWKIFDNCTQHQAPFFLLFKIFKPLDKLFSLPDTIDETKDTNIIFVRRGELERDILKIRNDFTVESFRFKPKLRNYEPFAVFVKDFDKIMPCDSVKSLLENVLRLNYTIRKV